MRKATGILIIIMLSGQLALAQDLDAVENKIKTFSLKKGIKMGGSLNFNTITYAAHGRDSRRDPFNWFANGNLNLEIFGLAVPFTFSYTNSRLGYTQPFNKFRFAPKYKWIKTYTGTTSMTFSSYTLAGHQFRGFGLELTPKKWRLMAMYGKLKQPIPYKDIRDANNFNASFKRIGFGVKAGYESNGEMMEAIFFKAKDEKNSIPFIPAGGVVTPKENIVLGVHGKKKIGRRLFVDAEYAISGLTEDLRSDTAKRTTQNYSLLAKYIKSRNTTRFYDAVNAGVGYTGNNYAIQLKYERVSPEYQTLGAYYFNSDLENYTVMPSVRLLKGKINFTGNIGVQKDNLDKQKTSSTKRFVGNINVNLILNEKWNLAATYSNFSTYTNIRPQTDPFYQNTLDTLNFYQVNQTFNAMAGYNFGNRTHRHGIMLNASYQRANDESTETDQKNLSDFYSSNLSYSLALPEKNINLSTGFNYNKTISTGSNATFMGPMISISNSFFKKILKSSASMAYNKAITNGLVSSDVLNMRWSLIYVTEPPKEPVKKNVTPGKKTNEEESTIPGVKTRSKKKNTKLILGHSVSFSLNYTEQFKNNVQKAGYREMVVNLGYVFNFR